jgi:cysteine sulfinate desulfinase/cysteine desulfurase-like protein
LAAGATVSRLSPNCSCAQPLVPGPYHSRPRLLSTDFLHSSGSACLADSDEPSHVIKAMKPDSTASRQMIRFSVDAEHSSASAKTVLAILEEAVVALRI